MRHGWDTTISSVQRVVHLRKTWIILFFYTLGIFTCGDGKEEENATEVPGHGMVDEAEAAAVGAEAKGPPLRASKMGNIGL